MKILTPLRLALLATALTVGLCWLFWGGAGSHDFSLRSEFKKDTSLADFAGRRLIIYFGYTSCPDVCPATLALLGDMLKKIYPHLATTPPPPSPSSTGSPSSAAPPLLLFISLDPERDGDLARSNEWLRYFYPLAQSLIAPSQASLREVADEYGVKFQRIELPDSAMKYSIAHSNALYLIDEKGEFAGELSDLYPPELFAGLKKFLGR